MDKLRRFTKNYLDLIEIERIAQEEHEKKKRSEVRDLIFESCHYSRKLYCKTLIVFAHLVSSDEPFGFHVGDPVILYNQNPNPYDPEPLNQVAMVYALDSKFVKLSVNGLPNPEIYIDANQRFCLKRNPKDIQYERMERGLQDLNKRGEMQRLNGLSKMLLNFQDDKLPSDILTSPIKDPFEESDYISNAFDRIVLSKQPEKAKKIIRHEYFDDNLDSSQKAAIDFALSNDLSVIHGPPGTGKTTAIIEIVRQAVANNLRTLVCAATNGAVDNIITILEKTPVEFVRLGRPSRAGNIARKHTVDFWLNQSLPDLLLTKLKKLMSQIRTHPKARSKLEEVFKVFKSDRDRQTTRIIEDKNVVLATMVSASPCGQLKMMLDKPDFWFDLVVIDEASQTIEPGAWMIVPLAKKLVLAGDHNQLPPTIFSKAAALKGLNLTMMERCLDKFPECVIHLDMQYRMNKQLMAWTNKHFYGNRLKAHESVQDIHIKDISKICSSYPVLYFLDTGYCGMKEASLAGSKSSYNIFEAYIIENYVDELIREEVPQEKIGIITPYELQERLVKFIISSKFPHIEVKSVDKFQGQEKDVIILSFVRSNVKQLVGFLSSEERINVAVTRARRHLTLVGDSSTLQIDSTLKSLIDHIKEHGRVKVVKKDDKMRRALHSKHNDIFNTKLGAFQSAPGEEDSEIDDDSYHVNLDNDNSNPHLPLTDSEASDPDIEGVEALGYFQDNLL